MSNSGFKIIESYGYKASRVCLLRFLHRTLMMWSLARERERSCEASGKRLSSGLCDSIALVKAFDILLSVLVIALEMLEVNGIMILDILLFMSLLLSELGVTSDNSCDIMY